MTSSPTPFGGSTESIAPPAVFSLGLSATSIFNWWRSELLSIVPASAKRILARHSHVISVWINDGDQVLVRQIDLSLTRRIKSEERIAEGNWPVALQAISRRQSRYGAGLRVDLVVPSSSCLFLTHHIPVQALARLTEIATLELERTTPLRRSQILHDSFVMNWPRGGNGTVEIQQVAIARDKIERFLADLNAQAGGVDSVRVARPDGSILPVDLKGEGIAPKRSSRRFYTVAAAAFCIAALLSIYNTVNEIQTLQAAINQQSRIEDGLKLQVANIRKALATQDTLLDRAKKLRLRKIDTVSTLQVWEEVTQLLPASTWVSEFRIEDGVLYLDGFSRSAAELIGIFSRSKIFSKVEFVSPVTRDGQQGMERFQLRMRVERRQSGQIGAGQ